MVGELIINGDLVDSKAALKIGHSQTLMKASKSNVTYQTFIYYWVTLKMIERFVTYSDRSSFLLKCQGNFLGKSCWPSSHGPDQFVRELTQMEVSLKFTEEGFHFRFSGVTGAMIAETCTGISEDQRTSSNLKFDFKFHVRDQELYSVFNTDVRDHELDNIVNLLLNAREKKLNSSIIQTIPNN